MGFLLHELIPLELESLYPGIWKRNRVSGEKDIVYLPDDRFSIEIKTSSSLSRIYGNRSYTQVGKAARKAKAGYDLAVNFEKFSTKTPMPVLTRVPFGWLDHADWQGQTAATGQQAHLNPLAERHKLLRLPLAE